MPLKLGYMLKMFLKDFFQQHSSFIIIGSLLSRKQACITGIVNGMDVQEWNPATDKYVNTKYDATTVTEAKALLKEALQVEVGLHVDRNIPVIGFIGRLEEQKGSDILAAAIPEFIRADVQIIVFVPIVALTGGLVDTVKEGFTGFQMGAFSVEGPAKKWEDLLLSLQVDGSEPGIEGEEIAPLAKENAANPLTIVQNLQILGRHIHSPHDAEWECNSFFM